MEERHDQRSQDGQEEEGQDDPPRANEQVDEEPQDEDPEDQEEDHAASWQVIRSIPRRSEHSGPKPVRMLSGTVSLRRQAPQRPSW